jgi:sulfate adenylyltransferase
MVSRADLATVRRWGDGALSPLEGPMTREAFQRVLDEERVLAGGKPFAWTIPLALPISDDERAALRLGQPALLADEAGDPVAALDVEDIFAWDKADYNAKVYGTPRTDHPGPRIALTDPRSWLVGGKIHVFPWKRDESTLAGRYAFSPSETRARLSASGWEEAIAFQTRNPPHRAHEYAMVAAVERLTEQGVKAGVVLNPLVGETKSDDIPAETRMRVCERLVRDKLIGRGDASPEIWAKAGRAIGDMLDLFALDMKMFYAGPREAVMHAIYRQNYGFTRIIIGRKHADAPFDDGKSVWGDFDAWAKFDALAGELLIQPLQIGFAAYFEELGRVGLVEEGAARGWKPVEVAGSVLREQLRAGQTPDPRIIRPEASEILIEAYRPSAPEKTSPASPKSENIAWRACAIDRADREQLNGHRGATLWLTGLPASGKSTLASATAEALHRRGVRTYVLDGDNIRHGLNSDLGFSPEDRQENIRRVGEVAKLFADAGVVVFAAFISPYRADRDRARSIQPNDFLEIHVRASVAACEARDPRGLYRKARAGQIAEFTGVSAPYEEPEAPELVIDTEKLSISESVAAIVAELERRGIIPR